MTSVDSSMSAPVRESSTTEEPLTINSSALCPTTAGLFPPNARTKRTQSRSEAKSANTAACFLLSVIWTSMFPFY